MNAPERIYHLPRGIKVPDEIFSSPIEHIELQPCDSRETLAMDDVRKPGKPCRREHLRVRDEDIEVWFMVGAKPRETGLFPVFGLWRLVHPHRAHRHRRLARLNWCDVVNISIGGICIEAPKGLRRNDTIILYLVNNKDGEADEVPLIGRIVHGSELSRRTAQYGVRFCNDLPSALRNSIYQRTIAQKLDTRTTTANQD